MLAKGVWYIKDILISITNFSFSLLLSCYNTTWIKININIYTFQYFLMEFYYQRENNIRPWLQIQKGDRKQYIDLNEFDKTKPCSLNAG